MFLMTRRAAGLRGMLAASAFLATAALAGQALAQAADKPDDPVGSGMYGPVDSYPGSQLYSKPIKVADDVWSAIGATQPGTYENGGHNNNLSFVVGQDAVLVVNGSASAKLAEALHEEIKQITDVPVKYVVDENGQGHAMLGNSYWKAQGATIIAHEEAAAVFKADGADILAAMRRYNKEQGDGTELVDVDETFTGEMEIDLGGLTVQLVEFGPAHSPGDVSVVVPDRNVIIAGDMAFHTRIPPIFEDTNTAGWMESFAKFEEVAKDMIIVPGHGAPTDFKTVDEGTRGYIGYLREEVAKIIDEGGGLQEAFEIDQTAYKDKHTYWELAARNAGRVFEEMEFE